MISDMSMIIISCRERYYAVYVRPLGITATNVITFCTEISHMYMIVKNIFQRQYGGKMC